MLELLTSPEAWIALATLTALELVLGIDNIIFISILVDKLPRAQQEVARRIGLFLLWKSVGEIHQTFEHAESATREPKRLSFAAVIAQIVVIDLVFSLDSIITAVGMVDQLPVMIAAVIISVGLMMFFARPIGHFVSEHPTIKMLALSFLVVVAVVLIADGFGHHVPKGYIYSAMAFSVAVEMLNIRLRRRTGAGIPAQHAKGEH
jgi:predicted tellurium resistance membrane protein TerC